MAEKESYLGTALSYPIEVNELGRVKTVTGRAVIPQSIKNILDTPLGSRYFLPEYGSQIQELLFEPNDEILKALLTHYIGNALALWEKRIKVEEISIEMATPERVNCVIIYRILQSNEIDSFIYPFYRELID